MAWQSTDTPGIRVRTGNDGKRQYLAFWRDHNGKQISAKFERKKDAVGARDEARTQVRKIKGGRAALPPEEARTFAQLCDHWEQVKAGKRSIRDDKSMIRKHLKPAFGELELPQIGKATIDAFYLERLDDIDGDVMSPKTARNILTLLGSMLREAYKQDWIARVPHVEKPKLDEQDYCWITTEQVHQLLKAAREDVLHPQLAPVIAVAAFTGLRAGEVLGLKWSDISFDRRLLTAQRSYDNPYTKTGMVKRVPMMGILEPILAEWRQASKGRSWLFPTRKDTARQEGDRHVSSLFQAAVARAELTADVVQGGGGKRFTFHDLRHSFASNWMASGGDVFKLQRILGHKSVTTTMRYSHLAPKAFEEDLDRFGASANEHETDEVEVLRGENRRLQAQLEALRVRLDEVGGRPSG